MNFEKLTITTIGLAKLSEAQAIGKQIVFETAILSEQYIAANATIEVLRATTLQNITTDVINAKGWLEGAVESVSLQTGQDGSKYTNITAVLSGPTAVRNQSRQMDLYALGIKASLNGGSPFLFAVGSHQGAGSKATIYFSPTDVLKVRVSANLTVANAGSAFISYKHDSDYVSMQEYDRYQTTINKELAAIDLRHKSDLTIYDTIADAYKYAKNCKPFRISEQTRTVNIENHVGDRVTGTGAASVPAITRANSAYDLTVSYDQFLITGQTTFGCRLSINGVFHSNTGDVQISNRCTEVELNAASAIPELFIENSKVVDLIVRRSGANILTYVVMRWQQSMFSGLFTFLISNTGTCTLIDSKSTIVTVGMSPFVSWATNDIATVYPISSHGTSHTYVDYKRDELFQSDSALTLAKLLPIPPSTTWEHYPIDSESIYDCALVTVMLLDGVPVIVNMYLDQNETSVKLQLTFPVGYNKRTFGNSSLNHITGGVFGENPSGRSNYISCGKIVDGKLAIQSWSPNKWDNTFYTKTQTDAGAIKRDITLADRGVIQSSIQGTDILYTGDGVYVILPRQIGASTELISLGGTTYRTNYDYLPSLTQYVKFNNAIIPHMD